MLYLIGLGLNFKGISLEGLEAVKKCKKIYLESYTVDFPYAIEILEKVVHKKIIKLLRPEVESDKLVKEGKKEDVALLIYGCPLFATTHMTLILDCKKAKVKLKTIYSASVFDAIAETGLQLYKFGKIASMPTWQESFEPDSFIDMVIENKSIKSHSLILIDIGLKLDFSLKQLEIACSRKKLNLEKFIICSSLGTENSKLFYGNIHELKKLGKKVKSPYCFIIPGEMHFLEKEAIERYTI